MMFYMTRSQQHDGCRNKFELNASITWELS